MCDKKWGYGVNRMSQTAARMCDKKWGYGLNTMSQCSQNVTRSGGTE